MQYPPLPKGWHMMTSTRFRYPALPILPSLYKNNLPPMGITRSDQFFFSRSLRPKAPQLLGFIRSHHFIMYLFLFALTFPKKVPPYPMDLISSHSGILKRDI
eukprot:TRINITY_DN9817_c0_g2_i2.p1 TRINITY_DN9817_c0_g2~~TRINITY_DN9817_c0_g2_i2.p1  ORF type:complete len:102 (-),score=5.13 TRINITY_DN9817_c0_g2_i2:1604-1909(-)